MNLKLISSSILVALLLFSSLGPVGLVQAESQPGTLFTVLPAPQEKIDRDLKGRLESLQAGEMITVIVQLRERANLTEGRGLKRAQRLAKAIQLLKATADGTQGPLKVLLRLRQRQGHVLSFTPFWGFNGFSVTADAATVQELAAKPGVLSISSDAVDIVPVADTLPDLSNPGPNVSLISAPALWSLGYTGQGVVVASMDSGVDLSHPELAAHWRGGTNSWFDPFGQHPSTPTDLSGHGTWTTGVMVAGDSGGSSIGVAPGAQWISVKIFDDQGSSTATAIHQGFQWLLDPDNDPATADAPEVVNNSWAFGGPGCNLEFEPDLQALRAAGILPIFAAGNYGSSPSTSTSPANNPSALAVGAINNNGLVYSLSSRGPTTCGGSTGVFPELVAPGVNVNTTDLGGFYTTSSGTSLAAPHVAGGLAVLLSAYPNLTAAQQQDALIAATVDLGVSGPDNSYGSGRLDLWNAFQWLASLPTETPTPLSTFTLEPSFTPTSGSTDTPTVLPTSTATTPPTATQTPASLPTATQTFTSVPTNTFTPLPTFTSTLPPTATKTATAIPTFTRTATATATPSQTKTPTALPTFTRTATPTSPATLVPTATNPSVASLYFSTLGNTNPPGVSGSADDADLYFYNGSTFSRAVDASGTGSLLALPSSANVDGFDRVDATHFYLSFGGSVSLSGLGTVEDEDVVFYNAGTWSLFFDGSVNGLGGTDLDAISIAGGSLYFSTDDNDLPPGAGGSGDDADLYRWNGGSSHTRVFDASTAGFAGSADVDGLVWVDTTHFYLSFNVDDVTLPGGAGTVQDEDIVYNNSSAWSIYFDGTAKGLTNSNQDIDAFDLP